ncbi:Flp family type IVb pilin [Vibrio sinaloensis]|nr:Flp family type IVb pilin [Vibrio sinaloensis]
MLLKAHFTLSKKDERGVTAIEYAIIGVAISAIVLAMFNSDLKKPLLIQQ